MTLDDLFQRHSGWLKAGADKGPVISSRIRIARNLSNTTFPDQVIEQEHIHVWNQVARAFDKLANNEDFLRCRMDELNPLDRKLLLERHLVSRELANRQNGCGVFINKDECLSVMVNEEDHLRLQSLQPGLTLHKAWEIATVLDDELEKNISYAFSSRLGYLTACPSNVGTGLRASAMLHLPGLTLTEEIKPVINAISKIGLAVRGLWGEKSEASGHMFQISNQITLGKSETEIIAHLEQIVLEIVEHENNARQHLMEKQTIRVRDHVARAYGLLAHAKLMTTNEALNLLSALRLGIDLGLLTEIAHHEIDQLFIQIHPAHLQKEVGTELNTDERDIQRAQKIRKFLKKNLSH